MTLELTISYLFLFVYLQLVFQNFSCCQGSKIDLEWNSPKVYGDAYIEKYVLRLDGSNYAEISKDKCSYAFTSCEPGVSYTFQLQVIV